MSSATRRNDDSVSVGASSTPPFDRGSRTITRSSRSPITRSEASQSRALSCFNHAVAVGRRRAPEHPCPVGELEPIARGPQGGEVDGFFVDR